MLLCQPADNGLDRGAGVTVLLRQEVVSGRLREMHLVGGRVRLKEFATVVLKGKTDRVCACSFLDRRQGALDSFVLQRPRISVETRVETVPPRAAVPLWCRHLCPPSFCVGIRGQADDPTPKRHTQSRMSRPAPQSRPAVPDRARQCLSVGLPGC